MRPDRFFTRRNTDYAGFSVKLLVMVDIIREIDPRLDADVMRAGLGPQKHVLMTFNGDMNLLFAVLRLKRYAAGLEVQEHLGIHGKIIVLQFQCIAFVQRKLNRLVAEQVAHQNVAGQRVSLRQIESHLIVLDAALAGVTLMSADGIVKRRILQVSGRIIDGKIFPSSV